jgi:hypothetical protein
MMFYAIDLVFRNLGVEQTSPRSRPHFGIAQAQEFIGSKY